MQDSQNPNEIPQESALDASLSWLDRLKNKLLDSWNKLSDLEQTNFQLGVKYMHQGAFKDAALRFRIVLWLNSKNKYANYMLGKAYVYWGKQDKAIEPLKIALTTNPEMEEARFFLAVCGVGEVPSRVPPSLMIEQLDNIAPYFEDQIANGANHPAYSIGTKMLNDELQGQQGFDILDLDIRTGRSGDFALPLANNIVGVEPSKHLISQARGRRIEDKLVYNELITKTTEDYLPKEERQFDIIQAYFSTVSLGGLSEFFEQISKRLKTQKLLLLAVEGKEGEGFVFNRSKMSFQHSADYITKMASKNGFKIIAEQKTNQQNPMADLVFLLKKNS